MYYVIERLFAFFIMCLSWSSLFLKMILFIFQLWRKFGDAKNDGPGPNPSTTTVTDDVFLILTTNKEVNN